MNIFKLIHNNFGERVILAKFIEKPSLEKLQEAILENYEGITKSDIHCNNLLSRDSSSITVGEWLELSKD